MNATHPAPLRLTRRGRILRDTLIVLAFTALFVGVCYVESVGTHP